MIERNRFRETDLISNKQPVRGKAYTRSGGSRKVNELELLRLLRSNEYGSWIVSGHSVLRKKGYLYVVCRCNVTGVVREVSVDSLITGKSKGPRGVAHRISKNSPVLGERYDAIKQRCCNPKDHNYRNYGGRGIKCNFSRREFIEYIENELPHEDYKGVQIDRIDNDGHYEKGNLRLSIARKNLTNTRRNRYVDYGDWKIVLSHAWHFIKRDYPEFKYSPEYTTKLLARGLSLDEVIEKGTKVERAPYLAEFDPEILALY